MNLKYQTLESLFEVAQTKAVEREIVLFRKLIRQQCKEVLWSRQ